MYVALNSDIKIRNLKFDGVNNCVVKRSIHTLGATCNLKVPVTAVLKSETETSTVVETAKQIKRGDQVIVKLGYGTDLRQEFVGYVKSVNHTTPLEIVCEDEFYMTRFKEVTISGSNTLTDVLEMCGLKVIHAVNLTLKNFVADEQTVAWVLSKLKKDYGLNIFFDMNGGVIAGRAFDIISSTVKYKLRWNTVSDDDLKFMLAEENKLKIKAICYKKDGEKVEAEIGADGGAKKTLYFYDVENISELKSLAELELKKYSYDGYSGKVTTMLQPYAEPCMIAEMVDTIYPDRDGRYYIEETEVRFGINGAKRDVTIGIKI